MKKVFDRFNGNKVSIALNSGTAIPQCRTGYLEVDGDWAFLYDKDGENKIYRFAVNVNVNNVISIELVIRG